MREWVIPEAGPLGHLAAHPEASRANQERVLVLSNLTANWGRPLLVGAGDHGRALAAYMTRQLRYQSVSEPQAGRVGGSDHRQRDRQADHAAFARNRPRRNASGGQLRQRLLVRLRLQFAWKTETQPLPPISAPRSLFERLFGVGLHRALRIARAVSRCAAASSIP